LFEYSKRKQIKINYGNKIENADVYYFDLVYGVDEEDGED